MRFHRPPDIQRDVYDVLAWIVTATVGVLALAHASGRAATLIHLEGMPTPVAWVVFVCGSLAFGATVGRLSGHASSKLRKPVHVVSWLVFLGSVERVFSAQLIVVALALALIAASFAKPGAASTTRVSLLYLFDFVATVVAFAMLADEWTLGAFFVQCALCGSFLAREHARSVRARLAQRRGSVPMRPHDFLPPRAASTRGALASLLIAACALAITSEAARWWRASIESPAQKKSAKREARVVRNNKAQPRWQAEVQFGGAPTTGSADRIRATVAVHDAQGQGTWSDGRPLYLTLHHLDQITSQGVRNSDPDRMRALVDADDGDDDGWVVLRKLNNTPLLELQIESEELVRSPDGSALLRYEPVLAVQLERVMYDDDVALLTADAERLHRYTLFCGQFQPAVARDTGARARHEDPRFVQLPPMSPALDRLASVARETTRGANTDRERVERVMEYLWGFEYALAGVQGTGLPALVDFLELRSGACEAFASTATVLLRSLGISTRLVTGFLATEFDEESARYVVRQRHGHAWIEVYFERVGWVRFDPTPSDDGPGPRDGGALRRDDLATWSSNLLESAKSLALARADAPSVLELGAELARAPRVWFESVRARERSGQMIALVSIAAAVGWIVARLIARRRAGGAPAANVVRALRHEERLLAALRKRGHVRGPSQTLREFAERVLEHERRHARDVEWELVRAVEVLYAVRWGAQELSDEHIKLLENVIARCESTPRPNGSALPA